MILLPNLRHKMDGTYWISSHPETEEEGDPFACLFDENARCYFFREVKRGPWYWPLYRRTGKIWEGHRNDPLPFDIIRKT